MRKREGVAEASRQPMERGRLGERGQPMTGRVARRVWVGGARRAAVRGGGRGEERRGEGRHDAELLGAGLHRPGQRAQPGARHLLPPVPGGRRAAPRVDPRREPRGPAEPPGLEPRARGHPLLAALRRGRLRALRAAAEAAPGGRALALPPPGACPQRPDLHCRNRPSPRALKQPLLDHSDDEVIAEDHNYSLKDAVAAAGQQTEMKAVQPLPEKQQLTAARRCPTSRPRKIFSIIRELAEKKQLSEETVSLLQAQFSDLPCESHSWRQMTEYSLEMKQFACVLHLYHNKAYDYLRKIFPLPHPSSLTNWLSNNDAAPGFSSDIFIRLQERVEKGDQGYRYCALMVQDMALQKQQEWDPQTKRLTGFVDVGAGVLDADEAPLASEVVILMAVGITSPWRAPLGYFFVNSSSGHLLAQLLRQTVNKLNNIGVAVLSVTSGATARGAEIARALGIRIDPDKIQCTFQHPPGSAHCIAYFFDACHALQLIRNALQCFQKIQWLSEAAQWQHVVELAALQEKRVLELCSPRSGCPGSEERRYLKVNLATQLFSEGAADALEHLQKLGLASFQNCGGTIKFVRLMSRLCDVFHGKSPYGRGLKGPLLAGNYSKISHLFNEAKSCFVTLTDSLGRCIIKSKRKLGFLSFLLNAESLEWLYTNYVLPEGVPLHRLLTYTFSLDQLELFLRCLRQACVGWGNPTCAAFQAAYYKLLASCSLAPGLQHSSGFGHVSTLDVSIFRRTDLTLGNIRSQYDPARSRTLTMEYPFSAGLSLRDSALSDALTDLSLHVQSITCATGFVAEQLASDLQCEACVASLFESDESIPKCGSVLYIKKLGGVSLPSASVHHVTSISEQVLRTYTKVRDCGKSSKLWDLFLEQKICCELLGQSPLFPTLTDHLFDGESCINNHYTILLKEIMRCYIRLRTNHAKNLNLKYHCGRHRWKRLKGKHSFASPLHNWQSSPTCVGP
ncbi:DNA transposase THAP9 isoform X2 [Dromaius novaehollandiae]|uniref:DNA transposase THAP9 isoform X2 n=1 Tax=Dromaius novaehollandiae TaxID=8790 RepID=UPI00311F87D5